MIKDTDIDIISIIGTAVFVSTEYSEGDPTTTLLASSRSITHKRIMKALMKMEGESDMDDYTKFERLLETNMTYLKKRI